LYNTTLDDLWQISVNLVQSNSFVDFNEEITSPMIEKINKRWGKTFNSIIPKEFKTLENEILDLVSKDQKTINVQLDFIGNPNFKIKQEQELVDDIKQIIVKISNEMNEEFNKMQKEYSRQLVDKVQEFMKEGYDAATNEHGKGASKRMHNDVETQAKKQLNSDMFTEVANSIKQQFAELNGVINSRMKQLHSKVIKYLATGYTSLYDTNIKFKPIKFLPKIEQNVVELKRIKTIIDNELNERDNSKEIWQTLDLSLTLNSNNNATQNSNV